MIEYFPRGIRRNGMDIAFATSVAQLPCVIEIEGKGFVAASPDAWDDIFVQAKEDAERWTFAGAIIMTDEERDTAILHPVDYFTIDLPLPPSTNALFVEAAGRKRGEGPQRVKTRAYKQWCHDAGFLLNAGAQRAKVALDTKDPAFSTNWGVYLRCDLDHNADITNRIKATEDLFVGRKLTIGDQWVDRCTVERDRTVPRGMLRAIVYSMGG